jgi:S1-C subfamily serine protease
VCAIGIDRETADPFSNFRELSGALVTKKLVTEEGNESQSELDVGDVIHSVNGTLVKNVADLRSQLAKLQPGDAVVLHVERKRKLLFVSLELER